MFVMYRVSDKQKEGGAGRGRKQKRRKGRRQTRMKRNKGGRKGPTTVHDKIDYYSKEEKLHKVPVKFSWSLS